MDSVDSVDTVNLMRNEDEVDDLDDDDENDQDAGNLHHELLRDGRRLTKTMSGGTSYIRECNKVQNDDEEDLRHLDDDLRGGLHRMRPLL